jgi:hypothetical protein
MLAINEKVNYLGSLVTVLLLMVDDDGDIWIKAVVKNKIKIIKYNDIL